MFFFPRAKGIFARGVFKNSRISEVDGREGAHSRRSALPRPPSADTDASNTVWSSERRAVGSSRFQLRAGLRVRSPGRISLLELSKRPSMSFSLAAVASTGAARAPVPRAAARARRDGAAKLSAWTRKVRARRPTHRTRHRSARRFRARGAWLAPRRVVAEGTIYYVASRGFGGVSDGDVSRLSSRPNVSRRSRVVTRSHFEPERRPEDRVERPSN